MPTWSGWQDEFLKAAHMPTSAANRAFLASWASHAGTNCANNPIDLSTHQPGSSDCHLLHGSIQAQRYTSHASAASAFNSQVFNSAFLQLNSGFFKSDLTTSNAPDAVISEIQQWGSTLFANYLIDQKSGSGSGPGLGVAPQTLKGWDALRKSVNTSMPNALREARRMRQQALRDVAKASRVHR